MTIKKSPITLTQSALGRVRALMAKRIRPALGLRISIKTKGCSGMQYAIEYAEEKNPLDEEMQQDGLTLFLDPKAILFLLGTEMDFVDDTVQSGFVFNNPNEKGKCGCGKSFHV